MGTAGFMLPLSDASGLLHVCMESRLAMQQIPLLALLPPLLTLLSCSRSTCLALSDPIS